MAFSQQSAGKNGEKDVLSPDTKEAYNELKADFAQLREDLGLLRKDIASVSASGASEFKSAFKAGVSKAEEKAHEVADLATSELYEIQKQAQRAVRKNPLSAVAAALAVGYFLSGITRR